MELGTFEDIMMKAANGLDISFLESFQLKFSTQASPCGSNTFKDFALGTEKSFKTLTF